MEYLFKAVTQFVLFFFPGCNFSKSNHAGTQPLKYYIFSLVEKNKSAPLYLLPTVALLEKLPRPKPLLLQLFDGRLKLAASGGRRVSLLGGHCCQQAVRTLRLARGGIISVFLGSVGWKADMKWTVWGIYSHTNVQDEICIDTMSGKSVAAKPSQTWRTPALLCVHMMQVFLSYYEWMNLFVRWHLFSLLPLKPFTPKLSR